MVERFDLAVYCARVGATSRECGIIRQDIVRGLKEYFEAAYGYDRFGAETIFMVPERLTEPYVYGFALLRILHDRRLSENVKSAAAEIALDCIRYGEDQGLPYGLFAALEFLAGTNHLTLPDLRYALVVSAAEYNPFRGLEKSIFLRFFTWLLENNELPVIERLFWAHSLIARHQDQAGSTELINLLAANSHLSVALRLELCQAWIHFRQPRLEVEIPAARGAFRADFVAEHMPFWVAHAPSWPTASMMRLGLIWLARLGIDPLTLAETYVDYRSTYADQVHASVAEILAEHHAAMPEERVRRLVELGSTSGSISTRRKFYRLGADLFGSAYLDLAANDPANSVRQWALRQRQKDDDQSVD